MLSVIMPVLDEAARLGTRLEELAQLGVDEVVVVDGGSKDATLQIALNHGTDKVRALQSECGRAQQMNAGARAAQGDVLLFLHADVALPLDALDHVAKLLNQEGVVAGCFRTWTVDESGSRAPWLHLADMRSRYSSLPYGDQALFLQSSTFWNVGGFPVQPLMEDYELARRLSRLGKIATATASVRVSGRRFLTHPLRYCLMMNTFPLLYACGVPSSWLAQFYQHVR